ncbi:MAG: hypothetical protein IJT83_14740 [Victivallales bacterium]|nr:hypothetical protein [Victivallales bacterium]
MKQKSLLFRTMVNRDGIELSRCLMYFLLLLVLLDSSSLGQFPVNAKIAKNAISVNKVAFNIIRSIAEIHNEIAVFIDELRIKVLELFRPFIIRVPFAVSEVLDIKTWGTNAMAPNMNFV